MNAASFWVTRLPSTMFGRLAAALVLVVGVMLAVVVALILRDRAELSMRVGGIGDSSHRIAYLVRELERLPRDARAAERKRLSEDESAVGGGGRARDPRRDARIQHDAGSIAAVSRQSHERARSDVARPAHAAHENAIACRVGVGRAAAHALCSGSRRSGSAGARRARTIAELRLPRTG